MQLLILCQDVPLDKYVIEAALAEGHRVTILTAEMCDLYRFPGATVHIGDRRRDHHLFTDQKYDAVIDLSGKTPLDITVASAVLEGHASHYTFVSSIAVLAEPLQPGADEFARTIDLTPEQAREFELTRENACGMLAECERIIRECYEGSVLVARPGFMIMPDDETGPVAQWLRNLESWRDVGVPWPDRPVQLIDVRDFARWVVRATEASYDGTFFITGPEERLTLGEFVEASAAVIDSNVDVMLDATHAAEQEPMGALQSLPPWMLLAPEGFMTLDCSAAREKGLCYRRLETTLEDTYAWESLLRRMGAVQA